MSTTGVPIDTVVIRTKIDAEPHPDVAMSIIREAEEGNHDVVVLGRRGMSMLKEFVLGSVSSKVIHHIKDRAVWLVE